MLFNSLDFAIFLPVVFAFYWFITNRNLNLQNLLIVAASYIFYGWWDWRFLGLIVFSTIIDYLVGLKLRKEKSVVYRKVFLWTSILVNLGLLGFFKYYNFFLDNFLTAFIFFGQEIEATSLNIILPVGISFYTFQTLSYTIDIYRKKLEPTDNFLAFSAFVSFFPQLVAGPIERASNLLPQFDEKRSFDYSRAVDGMRQILWGLSKKIVIADNCAEYANSIFNNVDDQSGGTLVLGALFFTFQIYGDFSGYSDIAIGTSRLFGFRLTQNFSFPYFSRDIAEFWRRWHISLSTWFRDYLYIPLGGSRVNKYKAIRNTFIIFIVSGFWHGASWTFVFWGLLNAIYFVPLLITNSNRKHLDTVAKGRIIPNSKEFLKMLITFSLTVFAWIFFRAENMDHALNYISGIYNDPGTLLLFSLYWKHNTIITLIIIFLVIEWIGREDQYGIEKIVARRAWPVRHSIYYLLIFAIYCFGDKEQEFIYFQF